MGSIFGGRTEQGGGGIRSNQRGPAPRNFAGDQAGAFDPMGMYSDMMGAQKDLYSWKQQQDMAMQDEMRRKAQIAGSLQAAPKSEYAQTMSAARAAADAESYMSRQKEADVERTRQEMVQRTMNDPRGWGPATMGSFQSFGHQLPAAAMHGVDLMQGRGTGWDQYAAIAGAGKLGDRMGEQWLRNQQVQQGGGP